MSSIYEKSVTKHSTELSIKVRSLSIGELQLLAKWLTDKVGEERAEKCDAVHFEVRGDGDDAELIAIVGAPATLVADSRPLLSVRDLLAIARNEQGGMFVASRLFRVMVARITKALGLSESPHFDEGDPIQILGVSVRGMDDVTPECIRVGGRDYVLTEGTTRVLPLPGRIMPSGRFVVVPGA